MALFFARGCNSIFAMSDLLMPLFTAPYNACSPRYPVEFNENQVCSLTGKNFKDLIQAHDKQERALYGDRIWEVLGVLPRFSLDLLEIVKSYIDPPPYFLVRANTVKSEILLCDLAALREKFAQRDLRLVDNREKTEYWVLSIQAVKDSVLWNYASNRNPGLAFSNWSHIYPLKDGYVVKTLQGGKCLQELGIGGGEIINWLGLIFVNEDVALSIPDFYGIVRSFCIDPKQTVTARHPKILDALALQVHDSVLGQIFLARIYSEEGVLRDLRKAAVCYERAIEITKSTNRQDSSLVSLHTSLAEIHKQLAENYKRRALSTQKQLLNSHPLKRSKYSILGCDLYRRRLKNWHLRQFLSLATKRKRTFALHTLRAITARSIWNAKASFALL